jgi:DNA sulfur modification protein DndE
MIMTIYNTRLRTSRVTDTYLTELQGILQLSTKAAVARLAIVMSIQDTQSPYSDIKLLTQDTTGFEFQRSTLTGRYDTLIKNLIIMHSGEKISEEKYYPELLGLHLERGTKILYNEVKYQGGKEKFLRFLFLK